ncbi:hypothetical protein Pelo_13514 [Pelomyxa schiedti]|nr:hypothetical protein Pelo_13514 [Pelomyxa schiedti]
MDASLRHRAEPILSFSRTLWDLVLPIVRHARHEWLDHSEDPPWVGTCQCMCATVSQKGFYCFGDEDHAALLLLCAESFFPLEALACRWAHDVLVKAKYTTLCLAEPRYGGALTACVKARSDICLRRMVSMFPTELLDATAALSSACELGDLDTVQWLLPQAERAVTTAGQKQEELNVDPDYCLKAEDAEPIPVAVDKYGLFTMAHKSDNTELLDFIVSAANIVDDNYRLNQAIQSGRFSTIKHVVGQIPPDTLRWNHWVSSCATTSVKVVEWLYAKVSKRDPVPEEYTPPTMLTVGNCTSVPPFDNIPLFPNMECPAIFAASGGNMPVFEWLLHTFPERCTKFPMIFVKAIAVAVTFERIEFAEELRSKTPGFDISVQIDQETRHKMFKAACQMGRVNSLEWMFSQIPDIAAWSSKEPDWGSICSGNHLAVMKWLSNHYTMSPQSLIYGLCNGCRGSDLRLARWIVQRFPPASGADVVKKDGVLYTACFTGSLAAAKIIAKQFKVTAEDVRMYDNGLLKSVSCSKNIPLGKWLADTYKLTHADAMAGDREPLRNAIRFRSRAFVKWFVERFDITLEDLMASGALMAAFEGRDSASDSPPVLMYLFNKFKMPYDDAVKIGREAAAEEYANECFSHIAYPLVILPKWKAYCEKQGIPLKAAKKSKEDHCLSM